MNDTGGYRLGDLEPLFAAERERRLAALDETLRVLDGSTDAAARRAALAALRRDAHAFKGAAHIAGRRELGLLVSEFEAYVERLDDPSATVDCAILLRVLATMRRLSTGSARVAEARRVRGQLRRAGRLPPSTRAVRRGGMAC